MAKNSEYTNHTRHTVRRVQFVRNGENCKMNNIDLCDEGLQFSDNSTNNVGENDLNPRMKYIIVRLDN